MKKNNISKKHLVIYVASILVAILTTWIFSQALHEKIWEKSARALKYVCLIDLDKLDIILNTNGVAMSKEQVEYLKSEKKQTDSEILNMTKDTFTILIDKTIKSVETTINESTKN